MTVRKTLIPTLGCALALGLLSDDAAGGLGAGRP